MGWSVGVGSMVADAPAVSGFPTSWPDATNTGVPSGTSLTSSGSLNVTSSYAAANLAGAGTAGNPYILENRLINGRLTINVSHVLIRKCRVMGEVWEMNNSYGILVPVDNVTIEDCEVGPDGTDSTDIAIFTEAGGTISRCHLHNARILAMCKADTVVEDSYLHDIYWPEDDPHSGGINIPTGNNGVIRHNRIIGNVIGQSGSYNHNGVSIYTTYGPSYDWTIEENWFKHNGHHVFGAFGGTVIIARNRFDTDREPGLNAYADDLPETNSLGHPVTSFTWDDNRTETNVTINHRLGTGPNGIGGWRLAP